MIPFSATTPGQRQAGPQARPGARRRSGEAAGIGGNSAEDARADARAEPQGLRPLSLFIGGTLGAIVGTLLALVIIPAFTTLTVATY